MCTVASHAPLLLSFIHALLVYPLLPFTVGQWFTPSVWLAYASTYTILAMSSSPALATAASLPPELLENIVDYVGTDDTGEEDWGSASQAFAI